MPITEESMPQSGHNRIASTSQHLQELVDAKQAKLNNYLTD